MACDEYFVAEPNARVVGDARTHDRAMLTADPRGSARLSCRS
jgi:hypothetical protein